MVLVVSRARTGPGQRSSDKEAKKVIGIHKEGLSYRLIDRNVGLSKSTVMEIVKQRNSDDMQSRVPVREMRESLRQSRFTQPTEEMLVVLRLLS